MGSRTIMYQKRDGNPVPVIVVDDEPSLDESSKGHLVDSNGVAKAIRDAIIEPVTQYPTVEVISASSGNYTLPAGGTWTYFVVYSATVVFTSDTCRYPTVGTAAGGTKLTSRSLGIYGIAVRIA